MKNQILLALGLCLSNRRVCRCGSLQHLLWNRENAMAGTAKSTAILGTSGGIIKSWIPTAGARSFSHLRRNQSLGSSELSGTKAVVQVGDFKNLIRRELTFRSGLSGFARCDFGHDRREQRDGQKKISWGHVVNDGTMSLGTSILTKIWAFDAMGWDDEDGRHVGNLLVSGAASAIATGWIQFDGTKYQVKDAPAYQDRNWGDSFRSGDVVDVESFYRLTGHHFGGRRRPTEDFRFGLFLQRLCIGLFAQG